MWWVGECIFYLNFFDPHEGSKRKLRRITTTTIFEKKVSLFGMDKKIVSEILSIVLLFRHYQYTLIIIKV